MCVRVCVYVCVRERERERERDVYFYIYICISRYVVLGYTFILYLCDDDGRFYIALFSALEQTLTAHLSRVTPK